MNAREEATLNARQLVSDAQIIQFLTIVRRRQGGRDADYLMTRLAEGQCLDGYFYTGDECGYYLVARRFSETALKIVFGCQDGPQSDAGSEWLVSFAGDDVADVRHVVSWNF